MNYKTYLINLKESKDRLEYMSHQLSALNMNFEIQEGVDGKTFDFSGIYDEAECVRLNGKPHTRAEKGCSLSHRRALDKFLANPEAEYALILEDDVALPESFKEIIDQEIKKRTRGITKWEYLSFNYPSVGWKSVSLWLFLFFYLMKDNKTSLLQWIKLPIYLFKFIIIVVLSFFEGVRELIYKRIYKYGKPAHFYRPLYLAGCYLINRSGAQKLVELNAKLSYAADRVPNIARIKKNLKHYAFVPLIVRQRRDKFESTMNNRFFSRKFIEY